MLTSILKILTRRYRQEKDKGMFLQPVVILAENFKMVYFPLWLKYEQDLYHSAKCP